MARKTSKPFPISELESGDVVVVLAGQNEGLGGRVDMIYGHEAIVVYCEDEGSFEMVALANMRILRKAA